MEGCRIGRVQYGKSVELKCVILWITPDLQFYEFLLIAFTVHNLSFETCFVLWISSVNKSQKSQKILDNLVMEMCINSILIDNIFKSDEI